MKKKTSFKGMALALMTSAMLVGASCSIFADDDNSCGNDAKWSYNKAKKELTITGKGEITWDSDWSELKIKSVVIKKGITGIGKYTFSDLNDLKKVSLPDTIKVIGRSAFENTSIESFKVPKNIKKIGSSVFSSCDELESVEWNYKNIPDYTFYSCDKLKSVDINSKVRVIGEGAFAESGIKSIKLPNSIKKIKKEAFSSTGNLDSITIPNKVKKIEEKTFSYSGIESIKFNGDVVTIGESAFCGSNLKTITLNDAVTNVGESAFSDCDKLVSAYIGNGLSTISKYTFNDCDKLATVKIGDAVSEIEEEAFVGCKKLSNLTLGKKVNFIGEHAFNNCKSLAYVVFPESLDTIDYGAFQGSGLKKVDLSKTGKNIDYWAFSDCDKLENVAIGAQIEEFHVNSIANCKSLKNIVIDPNNTEFASDGTCIVDKADNRLLLVAGGVTGTYKIPKNVVSVDSEAFYGCVNIKAFDAGENTRFKTIDGVLFKDRVYKNIKGLELVACPITKTGSYTIPKSVIVVAASAFQNSQIKGITIPNSVRYIGACAFEECKGLTKVVIPGSVEKVSNSTFWGCENLARVQIKKGVKYIRKNAFRGCEKLSRIEIPNSVRRIAKSSFKGCDGVTFYCKKSSYAMSYANTKWYISYKII